MTDIDAERFTDAELADAIDMGEESWFWPEEGEKVTTLDVLRDLQRTRAESKRLQSLNEALTSHADGMERSRNELRAALDAVLALAEKWQISPDVIAERSASRLLFDAATVPPTPTDASAAADTCPYCRHQTHGSVCFNMASDNDCACTIDTRHRVPPAPDTPV